jgi:hypothetical protein
LNPFLEILPNSKRERRVRIQGEMRKKKKRKKKERREKKKRWAA